MSTAKFEKLIDLIINEDQEKAEQLFHEIVVEKSREIYESLMDEESKEHVEEDMTEDLLGEIEAEEESAGDMAMEDDMDDEEMTGDFDAEGGEEEMGDLDAEMDDEVDMGSEEPATKDDIMDLEDKLDQLMAAFEAEFGEEEGEEEAGEEEAGEEEAGEESEEEGVMESVELKKVANPKGEDHKATSPVAANAGGSGPMGKVAKPVNFSGNGESMPSSPKAPASNAYHTKSEKGVEHSGEWQNAAGKEAKGVKNGSGVAAPKAETKQASGVNTKDVVPESKKSVKKMIK